MTDEDRPYSVEQVNQGRTLVGADTRLALGDLIATVVPASGTGDSLRDERILGNFADDIGLSAHIAKQYRDIACAYPLAVRTKIAAYPTVTLAYTTIRTAAQLRQGGWTAEERWHQLVTLVAKAHRNGRRRVTREEFLNALEIEASSQALTHLQEKLPGLTSGEGDVVDGLRADPQLKKAARIALYGCTGGRRRGPAILTDGDMIADLKDILDRANDLSSSLQASQTLTPDNMRTVAKLLEEGVRAMSGTAAVFNSRLPRQRPRTRTAAHV